MRMPQGELNKHMLECLIKSGAFDCFGKKRSQLLAVYEAASDALARRNRMSVSGQYDMFSAMSAAGNSDSDAFNALPVSYTHLLSSTRAVTAANTPAIPERPNVPKN